MRLKLFFIAVIISFLPVSGYGVEFVIINDTIEYPNTTDNNGFYFFYYNSSMPANWTSPIDYVNGQVYTRYEIISQASSEPVGLQFGIWQLLPPVTGALYENMESVRVLNGPGDFIESNSSPASWWKYNGGVDFTKMNLVWHFGINPYKVVPYNQQIRQENPTVWNERFIYWFPMKVRVTVVAVAKGDQFSGWDNYIKFPVPGYTINYESEQTDQIVPPADEYSYNPSMVPSFSGTGNQLTLIPGQTVYIRTKARDNTPQSDAQVLMIPARPAPPVFSIDFENLSTNEILESTIEYSYSQDFTDIHKGAGTKLTITPGIDIFFRICASGNSFSSGIYRLEVPQRPDPPSFGIDFINEQTKEIVAMAYEYSENPDMSNVSLATGTFVRLIPDTRIYFRARATSGAFSSETQTLVLPARPSAPSFAIDFSQEQTSTAMSSSYEYAFDNTMKNAISGNGMSVQVEPGVTVYIRKKATPEIFASEIQTLIVPERPEMPDFSIDFINGQTRENVSNLYEYVVNGDMSNAISGTGEKVIIGPGDKLLFRQKPGYLSFSSEIQEIFAPPRPSAPAFSIDFYNEKTLVPLENSFEYSYNSDMSNALNGSGVSLNIAPGSTVYFRQKATEEAFASEIQTLLAPERPQAPSFYIDYNNEQTSGPVETLVEYSPNPGVSGFVQGTGTPVPLSPGNTMYFRIRATDNNFASEVFELIPPARPVITSLESGSTDKSPFVVTIEFFQNASDFGASDIQINNAVIDSFSTIMAVEQGTICLAFIEPLKNDQISIQIPSSSIISGNFRSETFEIIYTGKLSGIRNTHGEYILSLSPNPTDGFLRITSSFLNQEDVILNIYSTAGQIVFTKEVFENKHLEIDLTFLKRGIYYIQLNSPAGNITEKFILQ